MKLKIKIRQKKDISFYSPDTNWTAFLADVISVMEGDKKELPSDRFRMSGYTMAEPTNRGIYIVEGNIIETPYGTQLKFSSMYECTEIDTQEDEKMFLEQILTEKQVKTLYDTLDEPFEYIKSKNIKELVKVKGIGAKTAQKIIDKFVSSERYAPAYNFFAPLGVSSSRIKQLVEQYGSPDKAIAKFKQNPYMLADDVKGIGFKSADKIALQYNIAKDSKFRIKAGVTYLLKDIATNPMLGSTWLTHEKFEIMVVDLLDVNYDRIKVVLEDMVKAKLVYEDINKDQLALYYYYDLECKIVDKLNQLNNASVKTIDNKIIQKEIDKTIKKQGFEFTDEQLDGIYKVLNQNVSVIVGLAGTGKSSLIKGIYDIIYNNTTDVIRQCAFSGQASKRIAEATGYESSTIHRLLGFQGDGFVYKEDNPLDVDMVIIDEISMVGLELFWSLIQAIPNGSKLIMLGDNGQLPPIGIGNLLSNLMDSNKIPIIELTKIHRQAKKSAIITTSQKVRHKEIMFKESLDTDQVLGELQDLHFCLREDKTSLYDLIIDTFKQELQKYKDIRDVQIIVAQNDRIKLSRMKINKAIQNMINPKKNKFTREISFEATKNKSDYCIREGDKIINRKNHYSVRTPDDNVTNIFNGSMGIVKEIHKKYCIIDFYDEGEVIIPKEKYAGLELAYAITCHSSQGSQFKDVIVAFDNSSYVMLSNEWLYTAITRAKSMAHIIAEPKSFNTCIYKNAIDDRKTFLVQIFQEI